MTDSIRGSVLSISDSQPSDITCSDAGPPLILTSAYHDEITRHRTNTLPHLPSHRFRFSVWHDLSKTDIHGHQLRAPRVRDGPPIKQEMFYKLQDENGRRIHHSYRGKEIIRYRDGMESWENATHCNLSYQDLCHTYQRVNFIRVLNKLQQVEELNLMDNSLTDLSSVHLPKCVVLNMNRNYLKSFKHLPRLPKIEHLTLEDNNIEDFKGLQNLKHTPIVSLSLKRNPINFMLNYRQEVFARLPGLKWLDGLPKQPEDDIFDQSQPSSCVIS